MEQVLAGAHRAVDGPSAGQYAFGPPGRSAEWDGQAWTGRTSDSPDEKGLPPWHRAFLPFPRHRWFWLIVVGTVLTSASGAAWSASDQRLAAALCALPGLALVLAGAVMPLTRHLRYNQIPDLREPVIVGLAWGTIAAATAAFVELGLVRWEPAVGPRIPGIVEETLKLLGPVLLLAVLIDSLNDGPLLQWAPKT